MPEVAPGERELHFPKAGIDLARAFGDQRPREVQPGLWARSTPVGVNVRAFDPSTDRARGGSRSGLVKYLTQAVPPGGWIVQDLNTIATAGTPVQTSLSGRVVTLVSVVQGDVYYARAGDTTWSTPTNHTGDDPPLSFDGIVRSAPNNQLLWFADGTNWVYFNPRDATVNRWSASAGTLPVDADNNTPRLICTWRGRTVLSGLLLDPQNWFMSAVNEPTTWEYFPTVTTPSQAVAGNNAPQGLVGDLITCLIPYSDDVLIFGGDHSIYLMAGDPMAGGQIDLVTDAIGVAWGEPWCRDPFGNLYFFSSKSGIYTLIPGRQPQRISQSVERLIANVDTGENGIRLGYNDQDQTVNVFITPLEGPAAATHLTLELRTGSWFKTEFANNNHNPLAMCTFDGNLPDDRRLLIGSWDGYVRSFDPDAADDDGKPIASEVLIGPLLTKDLDEVMLHDLQAVLGAESGEVEFEVLAAPTAELALDSEPVYSGTWQATVDDGGRNLTDRVRRASHAIYVRIFSSARWAVEAIRARVSTRGPIRRRGY